MIRICLLLALASLPAAAAETAVSSRTVGNLVLDGVPDIPPEVADRMLQYQNTRSANLVDWDPAGEGMLIKTRFAETAQLHWIARPGGARRQLTFFKEPVGEAAMRPSGPATFVYGMDQGGSENFQLYLFRLTDARPVLLTDGKSKNQGALWSRKGDRLVFNSTARNDKDFDFILLDPEKGERRTLLEVEGHWWAADWSPDDSRLLVMKYVSANESHPFILDVAAGKIEPLFPGREGRKISYGALRWSAGGRGVFFTSDEEGEFTRPGRLDLASRQVSWLTADIPWNVEELEVSRDGRRQAFTVNEDGIGRLYVCSFPGRPEPVTALPVGVVYSLRFTPDGTRLGFVFNSAASPGDVYSLGLASRKLARWTESETGGLPEQAFTAPTLIHYPTFDAASGKARVIPAFYYRPRSQGPHPAVVEIHGGPEAQERPYFDPTIQYWVNELGIAVLSPNVRGSDGYGKSYLLLDNGMKREDSVKDIGALLDWVARQPELDSARVAVHGGSYGGYMVLACLARYPERLKAGVDYVGISNFVTFLKNTKEYRRDLRRAEYGDEREPEMERFLQAISPTTLADRIRSRLFVVQGLNDPRVPASEAEQIVRVVRAGGRPVWYMLAKDEGHGFAKKTNRDLMGQAVSLFWTEHLLK